VNDELLDAPIIVAHYLCPLLVLVGYTPLSQPHGLKRLAGVSAVLFRHGWLPGESPEQHSPQRERPNYEDYLVVVQSPLLTNTIACRTLN